MLRKVWILTPVLALGLGHAAIGQTIDANSDTRLQSQIEAETYGNLEAAADAESRLNDVVTTDEAMASLNGGAAMNAGVQAMFDGNVEAEIEADIGASLAADIDNELIASLEADLNNELESAVQSEIEREVQSSVEAELESTINGTLGGL